MEIGNPRFLGYGMDLWCSGNGGRGLGVAGRDVLDYWLLHHMTQV